MASVLATVLPYPSAPVAQSVQQPLAIPQPVRAVDKRGPQTSGSSGTSSSCDGETENASWTWETETNSWTWKFRCAKEQGLPNFRLRTTRGECQYGTTCAVTIVKIAHGARQKER